MNHRDVDKCLADLGSALVVLAQPPVVVQPTKRAFHDPTGVQHLEPNHLRRALHHRQCPVKRQAYSPHQATRVPAVGHYRVDARQPLRDITQQIRRTIPILDMRGVNDYGQEQPHRIDKDVSFPSLHLLARVVPRASPPFSVVFTA